MLLFAVAIAIMTEAIGRFSEPPEVLGAPMLIVAVLGLVVNIGAFRWLARAPRPASTWRAPTQYGLDHATVQLEPAEHADGAAAEVTW